MRAAAAVAIDDLAGGLLRCRLDRRDALHRGHVGRREPKVGER